MSCKEYKYRGTVTQSEYSRGALEFIVLADICDEEKPPVLLEVCGPIAEYISNIQGTDAEERYIASDFYYDRNLMLCRIEVPSNDEHVPAKIIAQNRPWMNPFELSVFGPQDYIQTSDPNPMDREQLYAWRDWHWKNRD